ncbi:hypothetical protein [Albirhodobacter sp. R86504]|uniref:hypothetical protein n=1 Tax=Albirhodobacter sp. R86504 TaxID=3093848 RepID=UPI00366E7163
MRRKLMILAAVTAGLAVPVTMANSKTDPRSGFAPETPQAQSSSRPMDDLSGDSFGDLSVFDTISTYGNDQTSTEPYCDLRQNVVETLDHDFAETAKANSPLADGRSVSLYASDIMGTWTAIYTRADGIACVVSSGIDWEQGDNPVALLEQEQLLAQS